jgi:hypothetical protein
MMIKVITVYEPWASLIALGEKKIETRGWYTKYRGPLAIHAAKKYAGDISFQEPFYTALAPQHDLLGIRFYLGCVLAICNLVDCVEVDTTYGHILKVAKPNEYAFGDYSFGRFAWKLDNVHQLTEPIKATGRQRIWNWDAAEHLVWFDPYVVGNDQIWTPQGIILTGQVVPEGTEDAVQGLQIMEVVA